MIVWLSRFTTPQAFGYGRSTATDLGSYFVEKFIRVWILC